MVALDQRPLVGGIEAGGTKFVCAVGTGPDDLRAEARFPTTSPGETLALVIDFFVAQALTHGPLDAVGVGCFGPLDLTPGSPTWGHVTTTSKDGWGQTDIAGPIGQALGVPVGFDTDVNAAVLAEGLWGAGKGLENVVYVTVGTGIGGGMLIDGRLVHGLVHPEMGHMLVPREEGDTAFAGVCSYHGGTCLEGLASGPAMAAHWGVPAHDLPIEHPAWELEAGYLATMCANLALTVSPERIILGGGVMGQAQLYSLIRARLAEKLNGFVQTLASQEFLSEYIVPPGLGGKAGVCGALAIGLRVLEDQKS